LVLAAILVRFLIRGKRNPGDLAAEYRRELHDILKEEQTREYRRVGYI
jgi:hypothetical protein